MKGKLILLAILLPLFSFSQSFVFCPKIDVEARQSFGTERINIVFKDNRTYEKKLKEKCTKDEIFTTFVNSIKLAYPDLIVNQLDEANFHNTAAEGTVTLQVSLSEYEATFYPGVYLAKTTFTITIQDNRSQHLTFEEEFKGEGKQMNALGKLSGKIACNSSFQRAFDDFIIAAERFISENKQPSTEVAPTKPKADRLRELKALLDEEVLSQEEFDKEKAKILAE